MNYKRILSIAMLAVTAISFAGCGSGGSTAGNGTAPVALTSGVITDISGTGSSQAAGIVAKSPAGSLAINGVKFDVTGASIVMDNEDDPTDDQLQLGMVVEVRGAHDGKNGTAREIHHENLLKGPVAAVDAAGKSLTVLGQTVLVDSATRFSGVTGLAALAPGDMVKIDGFAGEGGIIQATRIHKRSDSFAANRTPVKIRGTVTGVSDQSFTIGSLQVTSAKPLPSLLSVGAYVKVEGTLSGLTGPLAATGIEVRRGEVEPEEDQTVRLQGMVTSFTSPASFMVDGITVDASALSLSGLANNVTVLVEGFIANGAVVATKVTILSASAPAPAPTPTPTPAPAPDGAALYTANCADCHRLGTYDTAGFAPDLSGKGSLISSKFPTAGVAGHNGITLSATNLTDIMAFVNAN